MATVDNDTFQATSDLTLWFKVYTNDVLMLADMPEIIPMRWAYLRDNWKTLRLQLLNLAPDTPDPDYYRFSLDDLTDFINKQRANNADVNPFVSKDVYYRFLSVFNNIRLQSIPLTNEEQMLVANRKTALLRYSKRDFLRIKKILREYRNTLADNVGLSDSDY